MTDLLYFEYAGVKVYRGLKEPDGDPLIYWFSLNEDGISRKNSPHFDLRVLARQLGGTPEPGSALNTVIDEWRKLVITKAIDAGLIQTYKRQEIENDGW